MSEVIDWSKAPEGATHYMTYSNLPWHKHGENSNYYWSPSMNDWNYMSMNEQLANAECERFGKKLIARPLKAWSGEGLPPVGAACEWHHCASDGWRAAMVNYIGCTYVIFANHDGNDEQHYYLRDISFRPARTAEQIAAEEREQWIQSFCNEIDVPHAIGARTFDKGYRKQANQ